MERQTRMALWRRIVKGAVGLIVAAALLGGTPGAAFALTPTPTSTPTGSIVASFSATVAPSALELEVGQTLTVLATVYNQGSGVSFGMPQFRLRVQDQQGVEQDQAAPILTPARPSPIVHYVAVAPGQSNSAVFTLQAVRPGTVALALTVSGEVCVIGVPGCGGGYWGGASATSRLITVRSGAARTPTPSVAARKPTPTRFAAIRTPTPFVAARKPTPTRFVATRTQTPTPFVPTRTPGT